MAESREAVTSEHDEELRTQALCMALSMQDGQISEAIVREARNIDAVIQAARMLHELPGDQLLGHDAWLDLKHALDRLDGR